MSENREPPLVIRLLCRSCPNRLASAFARKHPTTAQSAPDLLIGGRWVSDTPPPALARPTVVCLACGSPDPRADVFEVPPGAADAERNRHLIVVALQDALGLSERARERAAAQPGEGIGPAVALGQLHDLHERIAQLLAEGAERGYLSQALRGASARIGEILETTRRECRRPRRERRPGNGT